MTSPVRPDESVETTLAFVDALMSNAQVGLAFVDREFRFVRVSQQLADLNGATIEEHYGRTVGEIVPQLWPALEPLYRRVIETGAHVAEVEVSGETPRRPGELRHWLASYHPVIGSDAQVMGILVSVLEVTERRRHETDRRFLLDLHASLLALDDPWQIAEHTTRAVANRLNCTRCVLAEIDVDARAMIVRADHGHGMRPLLGTYALSMADTALVDEVLAGRVVQIDDFAADPRTEKLPLARSFGLRSLLAVPFVHHGKRLSVIAVGNAGARRWTDSDADLFRAVGHRAWPMMEKARLLREAEVALADRERLLERERVARVEAVAARDSAEEANRAKVDFLAAMSHELRTPLNAIRGYVELLEMEIHGPVTAAQREALQRIQASERHLLALITQILSYARVETGHLDFHPVSLSMRDIVAEVGDLMAPQLRGKEISYGVVLHDPRLVAWADHDKVRQILLNLLSNALKFSARGGHVSVEVSLESERYVTVRVTDRGPGIPSGQHEAIFAPFVQLGGGRPNVSRGVGLGLSISRDLARAMGGDLGVESVEGLGATFVLRLPVSAG
jgi:PAS domain S-box-containing protein